jgi:uncharacterized protein (DUF2062 family)
VRGWFKQRLRRWSWRSRVRTRAWLERHPRTRAFLTRTGSLEVDEFTLARGVAVGLFIGLTPTVGVQTVLMLAASVALRANFPAAFIASCINNPLTFAPFYFGFHRLGEYIMTFVPVRFESLSGLEEEIAVETSALIIGSLAVAIPAGLLGYLAFLYVWRRFDLHIPEHADPSRPVPQPDPASRQPADE